MIAIFICTCTCSNNNFYLEFRSILKFSPDGVSFCVGVANKDRKIKHTLWITAGVGVQRGRAMAAAGAAKRALQYYSTLCNRA
jgi:hypothetical protein